MGTLSSVTPSMMGSDPKDSRLLCAKLFRFERLHYVKRGQSICAESFECTDAISATDGISGDFVRYNYQNWETVHATTPSVSLKGLLPREAFLAVLVLCNVI